MEDERKSTGETYIRKNCRREVTTPITSNVEDPETKDYGELCPLKQGY